METKIKRSDKTGHVRGDLLAEYFLLTIPEVKALKCGEVVSVDSEIAEVIVAAGYATYESKIKENE